MLFESVERALRQKLQITLPPQMKKDLWENVLWHVSTTFDRQMLDT